MKLSVVDTHAHLDMPAFDGDRIAVIDRAADIGVSLIVTVGTSLESSRKAIELAESYPGVLATVGVHPHEAGQMKKSGLVTLAELAENPVVVAIGEIGLDFYRNRAPRERQLQVLQWQLELADRLSLPVIVHCRQAEEDMIPLLRNWVSSYGHHNQQLKGVIHCFSGGIEVAHQYIDMGFFLSFGAYIGYSSSFHLRDVIKSIPQDRLVVETDSPFLPPQHCRGKRNEPSYLLLTVALLAEIIGISHEAAAAKTTQNAHRLFGWPKPDKRGSFSTDISL